MKAWLLALLAIATITPLAFAQKQAEPQWITRDALPTSFVVGAGDQPLWLAVAVVDGKVVAAADPGGINAKRSGDGEMTMLNVTSTLDAQIKYDLYISPDGEHFLYTSTCALMPKMSNFESWPYRIHTFALGNARITTEHVCN